MQDVDRAYSETIERLLENAIYSVAEAVSDELSLTPEQLLPLLAADPPLGAPFPYDCLRSLYFPVAFKLWPNAPFVPLETILATLERLASNELQLAAVGSRWRRMRR